jgi:hypothetical protein
MATPRDRDDHLDALPATEAARVRHRDRKRRTTMVVDNAGVKRIVLAREARRAQRPEPTPDAEAQ